MNELRREWGTHLHAADADWEFPATFGEAMAAVHTQGYLTVNRDRKKPPVELPAPWIASSGTKFTDEEVEAAEAVLKRRSAIRD